MKGQIEKFWKAHQKSPIAKIPAAKDLLTKMLTFNPKERIDINGIKAHEWMQGTILKQKELIAEIRDRHKKAEKKRRQDVRKMQDLANSINPNKPIPGIEKAKLVMWPEDEVEGMFGEVYTFLGRGENNTTLKWYDLYNLIEEAVANRQGKGIFDFEKGILNCQMKLAHGGAEQDIEFSVEIFESREWHDKYKELEDEADEIVEKNEHQIFITRIKRIAGDRQVFDKLKKAFLLLHCGNIFKGLPKWAVQMEAEAEAEAENQDDQKEDGDEQKEQEEDDYGAELDKKGAIDWATGSTEEQSSTDQKQADAPSTEAVENGGQ